MFSAEVPSDMRQFLGEMSPDLENNLKRVSILSLFHHEQNIICTYNVDDIIKCVEYCRLLETKLSDCNEIVTIIVSSILWTMFFYLWKTRKCKKKVTLHMRLLELFILVRLIFHIQSATITNLIFYNSVNYLLKGEDFGNAARAVLVQVN